jgi:simple sugar transport system ATP-binding protein
MTVSLVEMHGIGKHFGPVNVLDDVSLTVGEGEIVALLGDNGAGKSTLIKILSGVMRPDEGEIMVRGAPVRFRGTRDAIGAGIETIYQNAALVDDLSVARNLFLGREPVHRVLGVLARLDHRRMATESTKLLKRMGLHRDVDPGAGISRLSGGERQSIAIARAMYFDADLIILDEPTNNLGVEETRGVLDFIRGAKASGRSIIFITHNIFHVFQVVDRIAILRRGRKVADVACGDTTMEEVERLIVGMGERMVAA